MVIDAYCIPMMLCYLDVTHNRAKYWTSPQKILILLVYKTWRILYKPVEFFISYLRMYISFLSFVCMYSRQQLSKKDCCKYCFAVLSCSEMKLVLGKALSVFFFTPPPPINIALMNILRILSRLFKTNIFKLTDFNSTSHNQHVIQVTTLPHLWNWKLI